MGDIHRWKRRVWVDGVEYATEKAASDAVEVSVSTVHEALKGGGRTVKGRMISPEPPPGPAAEEAVALPAGIFTPGDRAPLLRYPPGEGPLYVGLRRWS